MAQHGGATVRRCGWLGSGRSAGWRHLEDDVEARAGWNIGVVDIAKTPANSQGALVRFGQLLDMCCMRPRAGAAKVANAVC